MYDVLRADRCISTHSMEARVPFGDTAFVKYVMSIDPELKLNTYNKGKYLLRHAFEKDQILPYEILMREKAAFSDAVGHSMADDLKLWLSGHIRMKNSKPEKPYMIMPLLLLRKACSIVISLKSIILDSPEWLSISGCQTRSGRAVMSMIHPLVISPTMEKAESDRIR